MANRRRRKIDLSPHDSPVCSLISKEPPLQRQPRSQSTRHYGPLAYIAGTATEKVVDAVIDEPRSWVRTKNGSYRYGDLSGTYISIGNPESKTEVKDAQDILLAMSDEVAQTLLYVMAQCLKNENPTDMVRFHVNDSLQFRGIKRHRSTRDFRPAQKRAEVQHFRLLSQLWVTAVDRIQIRSGRGTRTKIIDMTSQLIHFAYQGEREETTTSDHLLFSGADGQPFDLRFESLPKDEEILPERQPQTTSVPFAFYVGLGPWANAYLQKGSDQVREMLSQIIQYEVRTDVGRYAMRFGLAIIFRDVVDCEHTIESLLKKARIRVPDRRLGEFKDYIEQAFEILVRDNVISNWTYTYETERGGTRWLRDWLSWRIRFTSPIMHVESMNLGTNLLSR